MSKFLYVVLVLARYKWISTFRDLPDSADGMLPATVELTRTGGRNWIQSTKFRTYRGRRLPGPKKIVRVLYVWTAQNSGHCNDKARLVLYPPRTKKVSKVNYSLNAKNCNVRGVSTFIF